MPRHYIPDPERGGRKVVGGGARLGGWPQRGCSEEPERTEAHRPETAIAPRGSGHRSATAPAARSRSSTEPPGSGELHIRSTATRAAPRVLHFLPQRRAWSTNRTRGTPSRAAIRSRALSSCPGCTPRSRPARPSRRPCVRLRRGSSHGLSAGQRSPFAASRAALNTVAPHRGSPVETSTPTSPDGLQGTTGSRP